MEQRFVLFLPVEAVDIMVEKAAFRARYRGVQIFSRSREEVVQLLVEQALPLNYFGLSIAIQVSSAVHSGSVTDPKKWHAAFCNLRPEALHCGRVLVTRNQFGHLLRPAPQEGAEIVHEALASGFNDLAAQSGKYGYSPHE